MMDGMTYYSDLPCRILEYIHDETRDSLYYQELAKIAPDDRARDLYQEFSRDEATHAANFRQVYIRLTGMEPVLPQVAPPKVPAYCDAVKQRIMAESGDFVKYGQEFIDAPDCELRDLFYITGAIEARHGMRLSTLLCGVDDGRRDCDNK